MEPTPIPKINKNQADRGDMGWAFPSRMDLLGFIARDAKANPNCQRFARESLDQAREWFQEALYAGKITDPGSWEKIR